MGSDRAIGVGAGGKRDCDAEGEGNSFEGSHSVVSPGTIEWLEARCRGERQRASPVSGE